MGKNGEKISTECELEHTENLNLREQYYFSHQNPNFNIFMDFMPAIFSFLKNLTFFLFVERGLKMFIK